MQKKSLVKNEKPKTKKVSTKSRTCTGSEVDKHTKNLLKNKLKQRAQNKNTYVSLKSIIYYIY